jgi:hypothetical protein
MPQASSKKKTRASETVSYAFGCPILKASEADVMRLSKRGKDQTFSQNLQPISLQSATGKPFEKVILGTVQRHTEERYFDEGLEYHATLH